MQLIQLFVPEDRESDALSVLREKDIDYVLSAEKGGEREAGSVVSFPLPPEGVDEVLSDLSDAGLEKETYTVVTSADMATTENFEQLRERYAEREQDESVASPHLRDEAEDANPSWLTFTGMAILAAVVVTGGLLRNSAAAVAGAMVIAPFFGTALSVSVGAASFDRYLFVNGLKHQAVGVGLSVASAAAVAAAARAFYLVPPDFAVTDIGQVSIFLAPSTLSLLVAVAAGAAGAFGFATSTSVPLSGVAIAAAIVPSAGTVGIGVAWGDPVVAVGALALLVTNIVCINLAAVAVLLALGNRPSAFEFERETDPSRRRTATMFALGVVLLAVTGGAVLVTVDHVAFDRTANRVVQETVGEGAYADLSIRGVSVRYIGLLTVPRDEVVTVTVVGPPGGYDGFVSTLERRLDEATGRSVTVHVDFELYEAGGDPATAEAEAEAKANPDGSAARRPPPPA